VTASTRASWGPPCPVGPRPFAPAGPRQLHRHLTIAVGGPSWADRTRLPPAGGRLDLELRTTGNGGQVQSVNGTTSCSGARRHDLRRRGHVALHARPRDRALRRAGGRVVAWVRVPSLANGRVIHMYYGNSLITSSTEATGAVFDAATSGSGTEGERDRKAQRIPATLALRQPRPGGEGDTKAVPKQVVVGKITPPALRQAASTTRTTL